MENIYLPISSVNLGLYFSRGIICPASYISNRNEDIQTKFEHSLLLSRKKFTYETNCSLDIVLTKEEFKSFNKITNNFVLADIILPISRVKRIKSFFIINFLFYFVHLTQVQKSLIYNLLTV